MMIDEISLSGLSAYLRRPDGTVILHAGELGKSEPVAKGESVEINAVDLYLETDGDSDLFARGNAPLFTLELRKEVFPNFFFDPHTHRVHQIAGFEDLSRAEETNMMVMEIDGIPTLVSPGNTVGCEWRSARYPLPKPVKLDAVAWTLAASRGTPPDALKYQMKLTYWPPASAQLPSAQGTTIALTQGAHRPIDARHRELSPGIEIGGYQIVFEAEVYFDTTLVERHGNLQRQSVGTPLLQGVFLVEKLEPLYAVHSLQELVNQSSSYQLLDPAAPLRRMTARLHFPAVLTEGESLSIAVQSTKIRRCEARLDATLRQRPVEPLSRD